MSSLALVRRALSALVPAVLLVAPVYMAVASFSIPASAPQVWVSDGTPNAYQIDTASRTIAGSLALPDNVDAMAVDPYDRSLWVVTDTHVMHFAPSGSVLSDTSLSAYLDSTDTPYPPVLNPYGGNLWLGAGKTLLRLNPLGVPDVVTRLPDVVKRIAIGLDEKPWVLTLGELINLSPDGAILGRQSLATWSLTKEKLDGLSVDTLGNVIWLSGPRSLWRWDMQGSDLPVQVAAQPPSRPQFISPPALDAFSGNLWLATGSQVFVFNRLGQSLQTLNVNAYGINKPRSLVFEPQTRTFWLGANGGLIAQFSGTGAFIGSLAGPDTGKMIFGVMPAQILPTIKLKSPASGSVVTTSAPKIDLTLGASCNSTPCDLGSNYIKTLTLAITLDGVAIPASAWAITGNEATYSASGLSEGVTTITGTATDYLGHVSATLNDSFIVDLPPVISLSSPVDGSLTNQKNQTLLGSVNKPVTLTLNGANVPTTPPNNLFNQTITLTEGLNNYQLVAVDQYGQSSAISFSITLDDIPPAAPTVTIGNLVNGQVSVSGTAEAGSTVTVKNNRSGVSTTVNVGSGGTFSVLIAAQSGDQIAVTATDKAGNTSTETDKQVSSGLPPDPSLVASPIDPTVPSNVAFTTAFLYTGSNPIQTGVIAGTIVPQRAAVLRGKVLARDNSALGGVTITIKDHPEFGKTLSRDDGAFDMAVNGGGVLTINYAKAGYLPAQRQVDTLWNDFGYASDVVLIQPDSKVTTITANAPAMQVAQGNPVTDSDGTRTATILFPAGTTATMVMADGSTQPLSTMNVRATEFSVGTNGPSTMPAELPPTSAYTYAVDVSADEAIAAGAKSVQFNQPVSFYVDNFLNMPVGIVVPLGYYDRDQAAWIAQHDGLVIKILSIVNGRAQIDSTGSGQADTATQLAALGITDAEQVQLATLYPAGKTLWRVTTSHFSWLDLNFGLFIDALAKIPSLIDALLAGAPKDPYCPSCGSIIESENRVLGERIGLVGTPYSLNYRSDRQAGHVSHDLLIPLTNATPPPMARIELRINVAGREFDYEETPAPNLTFRFHWDGKDAYGRTLQGSQQATVRIGYQYRAFYASFPGSQAAQSFASAGDEVFQISLRGDGGFMTLWQTEHVAVGSFDAHAEKMGGWTLSAHHDYDPVSKTLYLGNGERVSPTVYNSTLHVLNVPGIGGTPGVAVGPDGSQYIEMNCVVTRVYPNGTHQVVAGIPTFTTSNCGYSGDGGLATHAKLNADGGGLAVGADGSLYIADESNYRVRKVTPDGIIRTIGGTGAFGSGPDGVPATQSTIVLPAGLAVAPDGSLYVVERGGDRVRKIGTNGIISTVAGNGFQNNGFSGDGGLATQAKLDGVAAVALTPDGSLLIADSNNQRIRKITPDGIIRTVAGNGVYGFSGDGGQATQAALRHPYGVTSAPDGGFYIADTENQRVRHVAADGTITTIGGNGVFSQLVSDIDGSPATQTPMASPWGIATSPDGGLYVGDYYGSMVKISPALPGFTAADTLMASGDGGELYHFDTSGRHLATLDAHTGATRYAFGYTNSQLTSITDGDGNVTRIERNAAGNAVAIDSQDGQRTVLTDDANGYLASVADPLQNTYHLAHTSGGLLTSFGDPRGNASTVQYDGDGLLVQDKNAGGGYWNVSGSEDFFNRLVTMTSAEGRTSTYQISKATTGNQTYVETAADGTIVSSLLKTNGATQVTSPDGTVSTTVQGPDPRWGMTAPLTTSATVKLPSGLTSTSTTTRSALLNNALDPLSLNTETTTTKVNGRTYTTTYTASSRQYQFRSPANRLTTVNTDIQGRPVFTQVGNLAAVNYTYDTRGRLTGFTQGAGGATRSLAYTYGADGFVTTITDALHRQTLYSRDAVGRITQSTLPGNRVVGMAYDASSNVTGITPPGKPQHGFGYTPVDLTQSYNPPAAGLANASTQYAYSFDKQVTQVSRPDGITIATGYDTGGRLASITPSANGDPLTYGYEANTGRLASVATPTQTLAYSYDGSLLTVETLNGPVAGSLAWTYDANFRVTGIAVDGNNVAYGYDNDNLLTSAGALTLTRDSATGLLTGTTLGSATTVYTYNPFGEPATYNAKYAGSTLLGDSYTYDTLGRIATKTETVGATSSTYQYGYDLAGRLQSVTKNGTVVESYSYDANGNRSGGTYDDQDRLLSYNGNAYSYTANGELSSKINTAGTTSYNYDVYGNLKAVTLPDSTQIGYLTDGQNRRIGKTVNGMLIQGFIYQDQLKIAAELDGSNNVVSRFVYGTRPNVPEYMTKNGTTYRIVTDHLGSVRLVVSTTDGSIAQRMDYDSYGNVTSDTNPGFQPFGFAGGLYDRDTKLTRFGARDYDAGTGRWTSKDPIGMSGGINIYTYANNNPIGYVDLNGLAWTAFASVGAHAGAGPSFDTGVGGESVGGIYISGSGSCIKDKGLFATQTLKGAAGLGAGSGVTFGLISGDENDFAGEFTNVHIDTLPVPGLSIDLYINANGQLLGGGLGFGLGEGVAVTNTNTELSGK